MKPLALRIQAFGSYAGEFSIDFARLGRHGVFSITGPTGAGKSTIFDAIVYALYDDLPGFRVNSHVRSQFADQTVRTEVTLEFEADGRHWVLTRSPAQSRVSSRSASGAVGDASTVALVEAGVAGSAITRKREVAERLGELVGLDKSQFEQVVLIPQGRFEEVLKAKTQERADLLAKLFPVDVFVRTTDVLRRLATERGVAYEALTRDRAGTEERIAAEVAAIRAQVPPGRPSGDTAWASGHDTDGDATDGDATDRDPDGDGSSEGAVPGVGAIDWTRWEELRAELGTLVADTAATRDEAATALEAARSARATVEDQVLRWRQWRADTVEAAAFPEQEAADARVAADLERAVAVATLGPALRAWRAAADRAVALTAEHRRLRDAVDDRWVDGYDATALDSAADAVRLATRVSTDAAALERADVALAVLQAQGHALEADEADLAVRADGLVVADQAREDVAARRRGAEAAAAAAATQVSGRAEAAAVLERLERDAAAARTRVDGEERLANLGALLESATTVETRTTAQLAELRRAWQAGLAGRLAGHLVDGLPCPTCGATEHPDPAVGTEDAPGDAELEQAEADAAARAEDRRHLEVQVGEARGALEALVVVPDSSDLGARIAAARGALEAIDGAVADEARRRAEAEQLAALETEMATDAEGERSTLAERSGALAERRARWTVDRDAFVAEHGTFAPTAERAARLGALAAALDDLAANREAGAAAEAARAEHLAALSGALTEFDVADPTGLELWTRTPEEMEATALRLDERGEHRREVTARMESYRRDGGPDQEPDPSPSLAAERAATAAHDDLVGRVASMASRLDAVDEAAAELDEGTAALGAALAAKEEADTLAGLCAGLGAGPDATRLSLKNWVLAYYLRQVLAHANRRLHTMTSGRYALDLSGEHADGRRPWGLDISVLDAETGQSRPATTLSGGETFMAALALALGLADVVSAGSNYAIGALFVDEGFGSLDGDSLDTVIEVLRSLQDGGRMVGVISHVQELKDALPNGITITSTNRGSQAQIHYPDA